MANGAGLTLAMGSAFTKGFARLLPGRYHVPLAFFLPQFCTACVVDLLDDPRSLHRMVQRGRSRVIGHARASIYSAATLIG